MWRRLPFLVLCLSSLAAQSIREVTLDPRQALDLPISREITTITFPGPVAAVAAADMIIDKGEGTEVDESNTLRFHVSHIPGSNFLLVRSLQPEATGRLTAIYRGAAYVIQLRTVAVDSVASVIFRPKTEGAAVPVDAPPEPVKFSPRIGLSLLDRARAYPVLVRSLPKAVAGVTLRAQNRTVTLPDLQITVQEVYRFSREDALVFLVLLRNTTDTVLDLAPSTFAARVANEKFEQSIANGPRTLAPGETAEAEFAIVGMPDGTRNDLSADNAFTILINTARREPIGASLSTKPNLVGPPQS